MSATKQILTFLLILSLAFIYEQRSVHRGKRTPSESGGGINGFTAFKTITIDPTKVSGGSDLSDFPMLFSGTFTYLKTTGNGGDVTDTQGDDIVFTSDSGCTTNLKFEQESYVATTGAVNYWVKIPTLSTSVNTLIYLCYGKSSVTTFQGDPENVWDTNYKGVWHFKEDPAGTAPQMLDSTSNNNDLTANSDPTASSSSKINSGLSFDTTSSVSKTQNSSINGHTTITMSAWINPTTFGGSNQGRIFDKTQGTGSGHHFSLNGTIPNAIQLVRPGSNGTWTSAASVISTGSWSYVVVTYDYGSTANDPIFYVNGSVSATTEFVAPGSTSNTDSSNDLYIGNVSSGVRGFDGGVDEPRYSSVIRSGDWITTEHENQSSPATFYSVS